MIYARVKKGVSRGIRACGRNMYPNDSKFAAFNDREYEILKKIEYLEVFTQKELDEYLSELNQEAKAFAMSHWKTVETNLPEYANKEFLLKAKQYAEEMGKAKVAELIRKRIEQIEAQESANLKKQEAEKFESEG